MNQESEGVSTRSLLGAFFAVVVLCAVFFSLGFFLGYRQGHPAANALTTDQVPATSDAGAEGSSTESSPSGTSSEPARPASGGVSAPASQPGESEQPPDTAATTAGAEAPVPSVEHTAKSASTDEDEPLDSMVAARVPVGLLVQVAAVTNRQDAANVVSVLKSKNYPALVLTPAQAKARDSFYRVVAGPYRSRTDAERARKELTAEGFKPFIR